MDKLKMHSLDKVNDNVVRISELFPNCVTERKTESGETEFAIDFDMLHQELSGMIVEGNEERYQFTWPDKRKSILLANAPITKTLRPCREESVDFDSTENLYIEGDNLDVLKLLQETYLGKVKMIYIDPPYNTGSDFVYEDDFAQNTEQYMANSGQFDEEGNKLFQNNESNGRFHTDWLNMIYPRLKVAKDLLTDDGVIFISIDDHEVDNLKKVCNEVFGEGNFVAQMIWEQGRKSMAAQVAINHEYCLIYCKNKSASIAFDTLTDNTNWQEYKQGLQAIYDKCDELQKLYDNNYEAIEKELTKFYKGLSKDHPSKRHSHYKCFDKKGIYFPGDIAQGTGNGGRFDIIHPITRKPCKLPTGGWRFGENKLPDLLRDDRIHFGEDETTVPCLKRYLKETEYEVVASVFYRDGRGASKRLDSMMGVKVFEHPKDEDIIKKFVSLITSYENADNIILDFFSGSATTAHAVMQLNAEDGGSRKFIMVQLPEETGEKSKARKAGYKNICEIGKERIRRAGKKIKDDNKGREGIEKLDVGFRVLKLDSTNMKEVYYNPEAYNPDLFDSLADNIKDDRTCEDLLFQVMLDLGILLSSKIKETVIGGKRVFSVEDNYLMACFDENVTGEIIEEIAKMKPYYFVMRDSSLASDSVAANFEQIFARYSPETIRKVM